MTEKDQWRIGHMLQAIERIRSHALRRSVAGDADLALDAVVHNLQVIGEAAAHLSEECRAAIPSVPWPKIRGMRNILAHEYFDTDPALVWKTVDEDLGSPEMALRDAYSGSST